MQTELEVLAKQVQTLLARVAELERQAQWAGSFSGLISRLEYIEQDNLSFKLGMAAEVNSLQRDVDEMYRVEGGKLTAVQQARLKVFHQLVLTEFDLADSRTDRIFYNLPGERESLDSIEIVARDTLYILLRKHIPEWTLKDIERIYGYNVSSTVNRHNNFLKNPANQRIVDSLNVQFQSALKQFRPHDTYGE